MAQQLRMQNFQKSGNTIALNAATTSNPQQLVSNQLGMNTDMIVTNAGSNIVFINYGDNSVSAASAAPVSGTPAIGMPLLAGETMTLAKAQALWVDAVTLTGNSLVYFTPGQGN